MKFDELLKKNVKSNIRRCTVEDIPWLMDMTRTHYSHMVTNYPATEEFFRAVMNAPTNILLRNDKAFALASFDNQFYNDTLMGEISLFAGVGIYVARLMNFLKELGKEYQITWNFGSSTGKDIRKLAKILGANENPPSFRIEA